MRGIVRLNTAVVRVQPGNFFFSIGLEDHRCLEYLRRGVVLAALTSVPVAAAARGMAMQFRATARMAIGHSVCVNECAELGGDWHIRATWKPPVGGKPIQKRHWFEG